MPLIRRIIAARSSVDWRGWIALAWVIVWGTAYIAMLLQARAPQIRAGLDALIGR